MSEIDDIKGKWVEDELMARIEREAEEAQRLFFLAIKEPFRFNLNYRLDSTSDDGGGDVATLLLYAESVGATTADVRLWYANGPECQDRPGVLATYHPILHKAPGWWEATREMAVELAKALGRWIWLTIGEDRWCRIMVGRSPKDAPGAGTEDPLCNAAGEYQNDQYITTFSPEGEEHFVGCS